jgi:lipoyl(octanoyl) transferase
VVDVRLIIDPPLLGARNMAVDEVLLMDAVESGVATLRFYQWSEPTLSLGYFQRCADRQQHAASKDCAVVRRQTGGGAILHDRELTYSLSLPAELHLARHAPRLYDAVHRAFIAAISGEELTASAAPSLKVRGDVAAQPTADEPFLCFQRQSPGDVVLFANHSHSSGSAAGSAKCHGMPWKILGSAQRRHRGAILQHGSLLLETSAAAPELPGVQNLAPMRLPIDHLTSAVCRELSCHLDLSLIPGQLSAAMESHVTDLTNTKYGSTVWTKRR